MLQGGGSYAAPKPQKVTLPPVFVGSERLFEPKPTAANYYQQTAPVVPKVKTYVPPSYPPPVYTPSAPDVAAAQSAAPANVNYQTMLDNDVYLQQQQQQIDAQIEAARQQALLNARQAVITGGRGPNLDTTLGGSIGGAIGFGIDDETRRLMELNNTLGFSEEAQIQKKAKDATNAFLASLAARNMIRSGAAGQHTREVGFERDQDRYLSDQRIINLITSLNQEFLAAKQQGDAAKADAIRAALQRIMAQVTAPPAAPPEAPPDTLPGGGDPTQGAFLPVTDDPLYEQNFPNYPFLNPTAPDQVYVPVRVGSNPVSFEPKATAGNIIQQNIPESTGLDTIQHILFQGGDMTPTPTPQQRVSAEEARQNLLLTLNQDLSASVNPVGNVVQYNPRVDPTPTRSIDAIASEYAGNLTNTYGQPATPLAPVVDPSYIDTSFQYGPWTQHGYYEKPWWWDNFEQWGWQQETPPEVVNGVEPTPIAIAQAAADYTYAPASSPAPGAGDSYFQSQIGPYGKKPMW